MSWVRIPPQAQKKQILIFCCSLILLFGEILKRPTRADCKSAGYTFAGSNPALPTIFDVFLAGVAQLARASAFQAEGRGFESRLPLKNFYQFSSANCGRELTLFNKGIIGKVPNLCRCSSGVERFLGKEEVRGSNPLIGSW
jgi:hypothetical protein